MDGKIRQLPADNAREFWDLLSPEKLLFNDPCEILYRGQAQARWDLKPSLLRDDINPAPLIGGWPVTAENQVVAECISLHTFVKHCDSSGLSIPGDSGDFRRHLDPSNWDRIAREASLWPGETFFQVAALAQHYGFPTRLLDWSKRSYVAAFFAASGALKEAGDASTIAVWALNIEMKSLFKELEIIRVPGGNNANVAAQAGVFTLLRQKRSGRNQPFEGTAALDEYFMSQAECPLVRVTLPITAARDVVLLCEKYGVTAATLYPDYYGAAKASMDELNCWRWQRKQEGGDGAKA